MWVNFYERYKGWYATHKKKLTSSLKLILFQFCHCRETQALQKVCAAIPILELHKWRESEKSWEQKNTCIQTVHDKSISNAHCICTDTNQAELMCEFRLEVGNGECKPNDKILAVTTVNVAGTGTGAVQHNANQCQKGRQKPKCNDRDRDWKREWKHKNGTQSVHCVWIHGIYFWISCSLAACTPWSMATTFLHCCLGFPICLSLWFDSMRCVFCYLVWNRVVREGRVRFFCVRSM